MGIPPLWPSPRPAPQPWLPGALVHRVNGLVGQHHPSPPPGPLPPLEPHRGLGYPARVRVTPVTPGEGDDVARLVTHDGSLVFRALTHTSAQISLVFSNAAEPLTAIMPSPSSGVKRPMVYGYPAPWGWAWRVLTIAVRHAPSLLSRHSICTDTDGTVRPALVRYLGRAIHS
jgi:hypothetical protein